MHMGKLFGCDTVACFGIGKAKMLKVLNSGVSVNVIGDIQADWSDQLTCTAPRIILIHAKLKRKYQFATPLCTSSKYQVDK